MNTTTACMLTFALLAASAAHAQDPLRARWVVEGGLTISQHTADFRALPGVPNCCPRFESGSGLGPLVGARYEMPIEGSLLLSLGAGYRDHSALLSAQEAVPVITGGDVRNGALEHTIDAVIASAGAEVGLRMRLAGGLVVNAGLYAGAMLNATYAQKEVILEPAGAGTFLDSLGNDSGLRTRNANAGGIPDAAPVIAQAAAGVEYELPLNAAHSLLLAPGVSYALGLTDVVRGYAWRPNALCMQLALKYSPQPAKPVLRDTAYRRDTTVVIVAEGTTPSLRLDTQTDAVERTEDAAYAFEHVTITERYVREQAKVITIRASIVAVGVEDLREQPVATLRIEEFLQTNAHPLLGYVFFGEDASEIPARYARMTAAAADRFQPASLFGKDAMGIAHDVLNIVGYNLRQHREAQLTITGCNANVGPEQGNRALSRSRAEVVRRYLTDVWGIAPERLSVVERDLPAVPSNTGTADGSEENRRVEFASNVPAVTDVFVAYDTTRSANPPVVRLKPVVRSSEEIATWRVTVRQHGEVLKEFAGRGTPPAALNWEMADDQPTVPRYSEPLSIEMEAIAAGGDRATAAAELPTDVVTVQRKRDQRARDYRIEQYNLVLFDVGKAIITGAHRRTTDLVRSRLEPGSTVVVEGYSDRTGDADANRRLARARAQATAAALGRADATVSGIGEDRLLYDNNTPEGRLYCRTVRITVKTPVR